MFADQPSVPKQKVRFTLLRSFIMEPAFDLEEMMTLAGLGKVFGYSVAICCGIGLGTRFEYILFMWQFLKFNNLYVCR